MFCGTNLNSGFLAHSLLEDSKLSFLGSTVLQLLNFDDHISDVCKKASGKLNASFIVLAKRCILMNASFNSQFSYCPLIWMCHNRTKNRKINIFHERCSEADLGLLLQHPRWSTSVNYYHKVLHLGCCSSPRSTSGCLLIIYNDKQSSFSELLERDGSVFIHMRTIQSLAIEMFRVSRNISPPIMNDAFKQKDNSRYNLRQISEFSRPLVKSVYHGSESVSLLGLKIWNMLPNDYKDINNLNTFKNKIKKWKPDNCPCRLCKVYINNIVFA